MLQRGAVAVCPTDACYSLVGRADDKVAADRIRAIRRLDPGHHLTLLCRDLAAVAQFGKVSNAAFRLLKLLSPGPYTFLLPATRETPRRLQDAKRRTVGVRICAHPCVQGLLSLLDGPLFASTAIDDRSGHPFAEPADLIDAIGHAVEAVLDAGAIGIDTTTVIDLCGESPSLVRLGCGAIDHVADLA